MKAFLATLASFTAAAVAFAGPIPSNGPITNTVQAQIDGSTVGPRAFVFVYDNWTNPPSALRANFTAGADEIADDCTTTGGGLLTNMGINIANPANTAGNLTGGSMIVRFYDLVSGLFISGFNANLPALNLAAGGSARLSFGDGTLDSLAINIPATGVYTSLQINTSTWTGTGSNANVGYQLRSPNGVGSSADIMYDVTAGTSFNFGGNPVANTGIFLKINDVPEPASLGLLVIGGLLALRRR